MTRSRFIALAVLVLISLAAIALLSIHVTPPVAAATNVAGDRPLADVARELDRLRRQLDADRAQLHHELQQQRAEVARLTRALADSQGSDPAAAQDPPDPEPSAEELERADREREQRRLTQLEAVFDRQPEDGAWSRHASEQLATAVERLAGDVADRGAALVDAQCRASLCRLELTGKDTHAINGLSAALPSQLGWQGSMSQTLVSEPDGTLTSILYLSRDGHDLPAEVAAL